MNTPIRLTGDMIQAMGGKDSQGYEGSKDMRD